MWGGGGRAGKLTTLKIVDILIVINCVFNLISRHGKY